MRELTGRSDDVRATAQARRSARVWLRRARRRGCISPDTLTHRLTVTDEARTAAELNAVVADLPPLTIRAWLRSLVTARTRSSAILTLTPPAENGDGPFVIGRGPFCDFRIPDATVSERHAVLTRAGGQWVVSDLGSRNGTRRNGWLVKEVVVVRGDLVELGAVQLVFEPPETLPWPESAST